MGRRLGLVLLLPVVSHSVEIVVQFLPGTPKLFISIVSSVIFTIISTSSELLLT